MNKAKAYLSEIRKLKRTTEALADQIEILRIQASGVKGVTYDKDKVQTSAARGMDDNVITLLEAEERYKETIARYHEAVLIRTEQITELDNPDYARLLLMRYVELMKLDEIAREMGYSFDYVRHMHGDALEEFARHYLNTQ